ncbi:unnamed protein product, partial [Symbiodinium pilosum]
MEIGAHQVPFTGVREQTPLVHYNDTYQSATRAHDLESDCILVVGAARNATSDQGLMLDVCACGISGTVLQSCQRWQHTEHNGSGTWNVAVRSALPKDPSSGGAAQILLKGREGLLHMSYRAGSAEHLNHDTSWRKLEEILRVFSLPGCFLRILTASRVQLNSKDLVRLGTHYDLHVDGIAEQLSGSSLHSPLSKPFSVQEALRGITPEQDTLHLPGVTSTAVEDFVAFLYTSQLPWDRPAFEDDLEKRVCELCNAAVVSETPSLELCCRGWLVASGQIQNHELWELKSIEDFEMESWSSCKVAAGSIVGRGLPGAVLQDDVATLLDEVRDSNSMPLEDKVTVILGKRCCSGSTSTPRLEAHRCILAACSGFFSAALSSNFLERDGLIHLGFVEEHLLCGDESDVEVARIAFRALIRYLYTGQLDVEVPSAVDLLALLRGNFLQLEGPLDKACEACKQMALSATLQDLAGVARRAAELGLEDIAEAALHRLADSMCDQDACQAGTIRNAAAKLSHSLLVELVACLA